MPDWGFIAAGLVVLALGLSVALWALFADRSKGRERCPRCWYDMSGIPGEVGVRCSECGRLAKNRREFRRTRRRWRSASIALLLAVLTVSTLIVPVVRRGGWWAFVPTEVLIRTVDTNNVAPTRGRLEFAKRLRKGRVSDRQWGFVIKRALVAHLKLREHWPEQSPLWGELSLPLEFTDRGPEKIAIRFDRGGSWTWTDIVAFPIQLRRERISSTAPHVGFNPAVNLGVSPSGGADRQTIQLSGDVYVTSTRFRSTPQAPPDRTIAAFSIEVPRPAHLHAKPDDCMQPAFIPELDRVIEDTLRLEVHSSSSSPDDASRQYRLVLLDTELVTALTDATFAARIEFLHDKQVTATAPIMLPVGEYWTRRSHFLQRPEQPIWLEGDAHAVVHADSLDPRWSVRIVSDPELALRDFHATRYWCGSIELPFPKIVPPPP